MIQLFYLASLCFKSLATNTSWVWKIKVDAVRSALGEKYHKNKIKIVHSHKNVEKIASKDIEP